MMTSQSQPGRALPEPQGQSAIPRAAQVQPGADKINFEKLIQNSNMLKNEEFKKEKNAMGSNGELHLGETKDQKKFREQLEKITGKPQTKLKNKLTRDDYLNLLVTQLKFQDPSKPMEQHEMASQMAQFNTVQQLVGVNKTLDSMNKSQGAGQIQKLAEYIGKEIEVHSNSVEISQQNHTPRFAVKLDAPAQNLNIDVKDSDGRIIRSLHFENVKEGSHEIQWDGLNKNGAKAGTGKYTFHAEARSSDGKKLKSELYSISKVTGVKNLMAGGKLESTGGNVDVAKINAIRSERSDRKALLHEVKIRQDGSLAASEASPVSQNTVKKQKASPIAGSRPTHSRQLKNLPLAKGV